ncbi:TetR/AcrR family transcriptional regulator [Parasulfuritortus cantonensis]|uniref:TetR/AcrR family transcriptional regulator n=1 Tax=Parasulfuritortus cantonensis TaxID=2528202 RepID=A0A4V2NW03_9PROT|nr:TetR/AcrR family transcriptional regulator [Parasulfuritortus cantonensis]TCJ15522.1 TetR/AcrR family transcriptional regulator [Parasulfuritortus cantonensis]
MSAPIRDTTTQLVLDAALTLFTEKGYFATSVHDISRQAGVSIGSIYHHFGDKVGIARALYVQLGRRMEDVILAVMRRHATARERARELIVRLFELTEREPRAMAFMLYARHREFLPNEPPVCSSRPFVLMREIVQDGIANGEIRAMDLKVAATCLFGGPIRMITARLDGLLDGPLAGYLDEVWTCAWRSVQAG